MKTLQAKESEAGPSLDESSSPSQSFEAPYAAGLSGVLPSPTQGSVDKSQKAEMAALKSASYNTGSAANKPAMAMPGMKRRLPLHISSAPSFSSGFINTPIETPVNVTAPIESSEERYRELKQALLGEQKKNKALSTKLDNILSSMKTCLAENDPNLPMRAPMNAPIHPASSSSSSYSATSSSLHHVPLRPILRKRSADEWPFSEHNSQSSEDYYQESRRLLKHGAGVGYLHAEHLASHHSSNASVLDPSRDRVPGTPGAIERRRSESRSAIDDDQEKENIHPERYHDRDRATQHIG